MLVVDVILKAYSYRRQKLDSVKCPKCDKEVYADKEFVYHYYFVHGEGRED